MSKPHAAMLRMLSERLQKTRRRTSSGDAHTSSVHTGWSSLAVGGGGGKARTTDSGEVSGDALPLPLDDAEAAALQGAGAGGAVGARAGR